MIIESMNSKSFFYNREFLREKRKLNYLYIFESNFVVVIMMKGKLLFSLIHIFEVSRQYGTSKGQMTYVSMEYLAINFFVFLLFFSF